MLITKLEYQKNNPNRVNVFVDGEFAVGLGANDILNLKIYKDKEISQQELNEIISKSEFGKMLNFAINYISFRPRSQIEVERHLKLKFNKIDDEIIEKLKKLNLIDDLKFSQWFVDQRNTFRPKSARALKQELRIKGVDHKIIDQVLKDDTSSDFSKALELVNKKFKIEDQKLKTKISQFLLARGFGWDTIKEVLARLKISVYNDID